MCLLFQGAGKGLRQEERWWRERLPLPHFSAHSLRPSLDLTRTLISEQMMKSLFLPFVVEERDQVSREGQFRARQDRGVAGPVLRIVYCSQGSYRLCCSPTAPRAATSLPLSWFRWPGQERLEMGVPGGPRRFLYIVRWDCSK